MVKLTNKSSAPIKLLDLLRKRKMSFGVFLSEFGINSYESLKIRCERMGVEPPDEDVFESTKPKEIVNSPTDGIVVLEAPKVIKEQTGSELIETESSTSSSSVEDLNQNISDVPKNSFEELVKRKKDKHNKKDVFGGTNVFELPSDNMDM